MKLGAVATLLLMLLALSGCVSLQKYYARVDAAVAIGIDPIGGFVLLYWIDADGMACHGAPGSNGQPGPAAIQAARPGALQDAISGAVVTASQLAVYQSIPYSVSEYLKSNAAGYHFFQFDNLLWRDRGNGQAFRDTGSHYYSVPQVIDIDHLPVTISPVLAWGKDDCDVSQFIALPGDGLDQPGQHPTKCRVKANPSSAAAAEEMLLLYCVKRLPEGSRYRIY
jgi:hypothetical protein